jgi:hypothetical protein
LTICISRGPRIVTFRSRQQRWTDTNAPKKKCSQLHLVARLTCLNFSPNTAIEAVGLIQASIDCRLLGLLGPYLHHVIGTFNTCSWRITHWSLTDIGGGYNLEGAGLPHHTPQPSQLTVSTFHLSVPPGLRLSIQQILQLPKGVNKP